MAHLTYPDVPTADALGEPRATPLHLKVDAAMRVFVPVKMLVATDTDEMFIRIAMSGATPTRHPRIELALQDPGSAGQGANIDPNVNTSGGTRVQLIDETGLVAAAANFVPRFDQGAPVYDDNVYLLKVVRFSPNAQLRIRITNKTDADRDFVWVVADNESESRQPWIHATPPSISFDLLTGDTAQRDLKISNRGTGRLVVSGLDPGFVPADGLNELDVFPLPMRPAPNHTSTLRFEYRTQGEPKDITIPQQLTSDDPGPFDEQAHNRDFVLRIRVRFPAPSVTKLGSLGGATDMPEGFLPFFFGANAVINSGIVIGHSRTVRDGIHAFRWSPHDGMLDLGTFGTAGANNRSVANGMSADGSIVLGNDLRGFRWTAATGIVFLNTAAPPSPMASLISSDGSVVAGVMGIINGSHAFRWTAATGIVDLGTLGGHESSVFGMSRDGLVLVGTSGLRTDLTPSPRHAFRWTAATGMVDLGTLGGQDSEANKTSDDGSVVVGSSHSVSTLDTHAFRWTATTGMVDLGTLGGNVSQGLRVSRDGAVIAGHSLLPSIGRAAFRWTAATGMIDLGNLGDDNRVMEITGMSGDGSVIVGHAMRSTGAAVKRPYRWTAATGMRELNSLLASANVDMTGIELKQVTGVSDNGRFMVGLGTFAGEVGMPYIADLAPT